MTSRTAAFVLAAALVAGIARPAPACLEDEDCSAPTPFCDVDVCVECFLDLDCDTPEAPRCIAGLCEGCPNDSICSRFPGLPACHASGACAECNATSYPCSGTEPVCNASGVCSACTGNADCAGNADGEVCRSDGSCGDASACASLPLDPCENAFLSTVRIASTGVTTRDGIGWKWRGGAVEVPDLGDPTTTQQYALCIYRDSTPLFSAALSTGEEIWRWTGGGFRYRDSSNAAGIQKLSIKAGSFDGKINVKGKGASFHAPELGVGESSLVVQLVGTGPLVSSCWGSVFAPPFATDAADLFRDRASQ